MCGITGVFNAEGKAVPVAVLKRMADSIAHRGPDGEGFWSDSGIGFGHRRLSIIDLSPLGHQPMRTPGGELVLIYNGEIYNYQELRVELESLGHSFRSKSDTEVLLHSWLEWGEECVGRLNGMFAFAIWDTRTQQLHLVRDRYGIKPLYYWWDGSSLIFGSEIKALLNHPAVTARVSIEALNEYFSFQNIFTDLTLFQGVHLLPAASIATVTSGRGASLKVRQWWDYEFRDELQGSADELAEELDRLFEQAVQRQLVADVDVGAYLSGGMDSGAVTCIAAKSLPDLRTFTGGFDLSSASGLELGFDERRKAEFLSNRYKTEHYEVVLKAGDMERVMPSLVWHLEDLRVGQSYPNFYVARLASRFVKVVLSGTGGDELFGGYPWRYYRAIVNDNPAAYIAKYYRYWQRLIPDSAKPHFFRQEHQERVLAHQTDEVFAGVMNGHMGASTSPADYVNRSLYFEAKTFLHGLLLVEDKLSMAHSLETRVPFLDNDLVDFAMRVPVSQKLRDLGEAVRLNENDPGRKTEHFFEQTNDGKILLRNALSRYVPIDYTQGLKQGFSAPDASWFKGESIDYVRRLLFDGKAVMYDYIDADTVRHLVDEHLEGHQNRRLLIWSLLSFEWWCKVFLDSGSSGSLPHPLLSAHKQ